MVGIVLAGWKSYFIGECMRIFQDAQAGFPLSVLIFREDTKLFPRTRIYNKMCGCLERNGIYLVRNQTAKHPNLRKARMTYSSQLALYI